MIAIAGITFKQAATSLLDAGFNLEKIDSNFQTIKTEFKEQSGKLKWLKIRLYVRIKDSTALITGEFLNTVNIGGKLLGTEITPENSTFKIKYSWGNEKDCFIEMDKFARSLGKPVEYSTVK
ncbi:MAG: hypothetical protein Q8941_21820 [Bacteroidota bacterium]|nr:hypothetical protein [Bacteroidota bacterium]